ncbi:MAG: hypothetical protein OXE86_20580 [Alphaproteobacteria bacterium]|nr:hypothetical protein [Alphaproteobacteria bacterium]
MNLAVAQATSDVVAPGAADGGDSAAPPLSAGVPARLLNPCPQDKIGHLLASAVTPGEISRGLALEREILVMCVQRQELALDVLELESKIRNALPAPEPEVVEKIVEVERIVEVEKIVEVAAEAAEAPTLADMFWFSIYGTADAPRAGVVLGDGTRIFVGIGDEVPGVGTVTAIQAVPPMVRVTGATQNPLPRLPASAQSLQQGE